MNLSADNVFAQLAGLAMIPDDEKPSFLAQHPQLCQAEAAEAALQIARLRAMAGDSLGQYRYATAALAIASEILDRSIAVRACGVCIEALRSSGGDDAQGLINTYARLAEGLKR